MPNTVSQLPSKVEEPKSSRGATSQRNTSVSKDPYQSSSNFGPEMPPSPYTNNTSTKEPSTSPYQSSSDYGPAPVSNPPKKTSSSSSSSAAVRKMSTSSTVSTVSMDGSIQSSGSGSNPTSNQSVSPTKEVFTMEVPLSVSTTATPPPPSASAFYLRDHYGLVVSQDKIDGKKDSLKLELEKCYARAICYAIGTGDVYKEAQVDFIKGLLLAKGYKEVVDFVDSILKAAAKMVDLELITEVGAIVEAGHLRSVAPLMLYDMYRAAAIGGFLEEQMCAIALIAEEIGVTGFGQVEGIRELVEKELSLKRERVAMLFPDGHPCLAEEFKALLATNEATKSTKQRQ